VSSPLDADTYGLGHVPTFIEARDGKRGQSQQKQGAAGASYELRVPPGTVVRATKPSTSSYARQRFAGLQHVADLTEIGQSITIARYCL
jgi:GTPase involved in cell partitioning and DNA repair